jgi:hypothetical protein
VTDLFFDKEILSLLTSEEVVFTYLFLEGCESEACTFLESSAYIKLFDYYADEMPYEVAKGRADEPDLWIAEKIRERS